MNSINDTIVALCSGAVKAAISVIRVSGNDSFSIVDSIFTNKRKHEHQHVYYGYIKDNEEVIDEAEHSLERGCGVGGKDQRGLEGKGRILSLSDSQNRGV